MFYKMCLLGCIAALSFSVTADTLIINEPTNLNYGYKYQGSTESRESAQFIFQGTYNELSLDVTGYDIDTNTEIAVQVNKQVIGYLARTQNNNIGTSTFSIPASLQVIGDNVLSFKQSSPGWKWGVSDILLGIVTPELQNNVVETGLFGFEYQGITANRENAQFRFQGSNRDLVLNVTGYDIETGKEVAVIVNEDIVGYLNRTEDNGTSPSSFSIPASVQIAGDNVLSFNQSTPGWHWGVSDLLLGVDTPSLEIDVVESGLFGYKHQGVTAHRDSAQFTFQGTENNLTLDVTGFDIETGREVAVVVNEQVVGYLNRTADNTTSASSFSIPTSMQLTGDNSLSFKQSTPGWVWGIRDLLLSVSVPELQPGISESGLFGYNYEGVTANRESAIFTFKGNNENLTLDVTGFDIETGKEVSVIVNDQIIGHLKRTANNSTSLSSFSIPASLQLDGDNVLSFNQNTPGWAWGVSNLLLGIAAPVIQIPPAPVLLSPEAQTFIEHEAIAEFQWEVEVNASSYQFELFDSKAGPSEALVTSTLDNSDCANNVCTLSTLFDFTTYGSLIWRVNASNEAGSSDWASEEIIAMPPAPTTPLLIDVAANVELDADSTVIFKWRQDPLADSYNFFITHPSTPGIAYSELNDLQVDEICSASICSANIKLDIPVDTDYAWSVLARNISGTSDVSSTSFNIVEPITEPPIAPTLISPVINTLLEQGSLVNFRWGTSSTAKRYMLELINTENSGLSAPNAFVPDKNCANDICSISIAMDLPIGGFYQWRVRAENDIGESAWSGTDMEIIANATEIPPVPAPLSPATDTIVSQNDFVRFTWARDAHAVTYDFNFLDAVAPANKPVFSGRRADDICTDGQCTVNLAVDLSVGENHAWLVRGRNSLGASDWSRDTFEVIEPVTDLPGSFVLTSPRQNADITQGSEISFAWTRAEQATGFDLAIFDGSDPGASVNAISIDISNCSAESCSYVATPDLPVSSLHSWQVRAINSLGSTEWVSASFNIIAEPVELVAAPEVISPLVNIPVMNNRVENFQWEHDREVTSYEFYILDADNGPQVVIANLSPSNHCEDNVCSYSHLVSLSPGSEHSWHVRARYLDADSQWSDTALTVVAEAADSGVIVVKDTNVSGGGFQSDVTITDDGQTVYSSADNSGVFKSSNGGLRFESYNEGLQSNKVASLAITPDNNQILYIGTGDKGTTGGLFRSVDGGDTWAITGDGTNARFAGNHSSSSDPVPNGHPRSNGDLIVVDAGNNASSYTDDIVIAGSYTDGVRLFTQGGEKEASAVNTSGFVRSVAGNQGLPDIAYAAIQFPNKDLNGIYRIDYSNPSNPQSRLEYSTPLPEGVTVLDNGHVYAAIGDEGIVKFDGSSWSIQNAGLDINNVNRQWTAVAGYVSGNEDIVYAGTTNQGGIRDGRNYSNIWRSVDGGDTWSALVDADSNVSDTVYGQSYEWWYRTSAFREAGLGRRQSIVSSIDLARGPLTRQVSDDIIYVSGRGGIWKSDNGGESWLPAVNNMQATSNEHVTVNPNDSNQVVLANTDYVVLQTRTAFEGGDIARDKPGESESRNYDSIFDVVSDEIIIGVGDRDTNAPGGGEVFVKSADALDSPADSGWENTRLSSVTASNNGRVRAISYGYHNGRDSTTQTILAAVEGEGVYRYHEGSWLKSTGVSLGSTERSRFLWPDNANSGVVYLLDLAEGLYRSNDGGQSWSNIWPSMILRNNDFYRTGFIAANDADPTTLYVSIQGDSSSPIGSRFRVFRMTGADTGIFGVPGSADITDITRHSGSTLIQRPGPLAFSPDGSLWLTEQQNAKNSVYAGLYVMNNPASDSSFTQVTTNKYRNAAINPVGMSISSDGHIYISQDGGGVVKIAIPCRYHNGC